MRQGAARGLAAALVLGAALGGCGRREDAITRDAAITMVLALLPNELAPYRQLLDDYERDGGPKVILVAQQYAEIRRALAAEAAGGVGTIDLAELDVYSLLAAKDDVAVLDGDQMRDELADLDPEAVRAGQLNGLRFLPHRVAWQALIYNHAVLGNPPATWDELLAVAQRHPQRVALKGALYEGLTCDVLPFVWSAGGSGEAFDDAGALEALRFLSRLAPYLHPQSATFKEATIAEAMARGEVVLHLNWPFVMSLYASHGLAPSQIRSAALPAVSRDPAAPAATTVLGGGYLAIPRSAPHPAAALRLLRYLLSHAAQQRLRDQLGWFSARRDVEVGTGGELLAGFAAMRSHVRSRPPIEDYPRLSRHWQEAARAVMFEGADPVTIAGKGDEG